MDDFQAKHWDEFVGQAALKKRLSVHINSSKVRKSRMDHVLLIGPPGCGKTTLASIIGDELGYSGWFSCVMPIDPALLEAIVQQTDTKLVFFDELHRAPRRAGGQQEQLLTLVESGYLQTSTGRIKNDDLLIIAATTEPDQIIEPLWDRFRIKPNYDEYTDKDLAKIVQGMAAKIDLSITEKEAVALGRAAAGTPRNAAALVSMLRDLNADGKKHSVSEALEMCRVTPEGLWEDHLRYLQVLAQMGGTAGIDLVATHMHMPKGYVISLERLLVKKGHIKFTTKGRALTPNGWKASGHDLQLQLTR